jgi:hypothetical protein
MAFIQDDTKIQLIRLYGIFLIICACISIPIRIIEITYGEAELLNKALSLNFYELACGMFLKSKHINCLEIFRRM